MNDDSFENAAQKTTTRYLENSLIESFVQSGAKTLLLRARLRSNFDEVFLASPIYRYPIYRDTIGTQSIIESTFALVINKCHTESSRGGQRRRRGAP